MARPLWQKLTGHYDCEPVAVYEIDTGDYLGDYGEGRSWWLGKWKSCGSLGSIKNFKFDSNKHTLNKESTLK